MCGIAGYIGKKNDAKDVLLAILAKLEYRGYDSAGLAVCAGGDVLHVRSKGELDNLRKKLMSSPSFFGGAGIAHTRWATHGEPSEKNAHPHEFGGVYVVHNGIIENHKEIRGRMEAEGYVFKSDTDTEVVPALIDFYKNTGVDTGEAFKLALKDLKGAFALVVFDSSDGERIYASRLSSPLILGIGDGGEYFLASDALALLDYTKRVVYLDDYDILELSREGYRIENLASGGGKRVKEELLNLDVGVVSKEGFGSYMLKEIYEQPDSLRAGIRGRINLDGLKIVLGGLDDVRCELANAKRIMFLACGTSYNACLAMKSVFEELTGVPIVVGLASEARYGADRVLPGTVCFFVSQSGETADTLGALRRYKKEGALCLGVVNVVASSIAREAHAGVYNHAGPEISVASTKAFSSQMMILLMIALLIAELKGIEVDDLDGLFVDLAGIGDIFEKMFGSVDKFAAKVAKRINGADSMYFLGRGSLMALALEGALKTKEISYVHAEGYAGGELKHGPIALIDKGFPVVIFAQRGELGDKIISAGEEVKSRGAMVIGVGESRVAGLKELCDESYLLPEFHRYLSAILMSPFVQLLAYHLAKLKGLNVDKPRNLAKSVTVE